MVRASLRLACALLVGLVMLAVPTESHAEIRVALVVGAGSYRNAPRLANPPNDASDIRDALNRLGFDTEALIDPDRSSLEGAIRRFGRRARTADVAVLFYAGHALEYGGRNWLIPVTADIGSEKDLRFEAIDLADITDQLDGGPRLSVLFLDSCRDNPFRAKLSDASRGLARSGLAEVHVAAGALVAFSTAPGTTAEDGAGRNSPFTTALLANIATPGLELRQMLDRVRRDVRLATRGRQIPWENSAMEGEFYMVPPAATLPPPSPPLAVAVPAPPPAAASAPVSGEAERVFWESVRNSDDPGDLELYLQRYPNGEYADLAHRFVARLRARQATRETTPPPTGGHPVGAAPAVVAPPAAPHGGETDRRGDAVPPPAAPAPAAPPPQARAPRPVAAAPRPVVAKPKPTSVPPESLAARTPEPQAPYPPPVPPSVERRPPPAAPPAIVVAPPAAVSGGCNLSHVC